MSKKPNIDADLQDETDESSEEISESGAEYLEDATGQTPIEQAKNAEILAQQDAEEAWGDMEDARERARRAQLVSEVLGRLHERELDSTADAVRDAVENENGTGVDDS